MQKTLIIIGVLVVLIGLGWPLLSKLPLGRLPGDIVLDKPGLKVFFPITTMIVISAIATLILWFFKK